MKNKKGFTLIELLAVIVVLAIIALIATPIVMNTIKNAKKGAAERSADNYVKAVEQKVAESRIDGTKISDGIYNIKPDGNLCPASGCGENDKDKITIDMSGNKPTSGRIKIKNNAVLSDDIDMKIGDYIIYYNTDKGEDKYYASQIKSYELNFSLTNLEYAQAYSIEYAAPNGDDMYFAAGTPTTIKSNEPLRILLKSTEGYKVSKESINVTGAKYTLSGDSLNLYIRLSKITGNVTITANGVARKICDYDSIDNTYFCNTGNGSVKFDLLEDGDTTTLTESTGRIAQSGQISLIQHNYSGDTVRWSGDRINHKNDDISKQAVKAKEELENKTSSWTKIKEIGTISLPTAEQIAAASGQVFNDNKISSSNLAKFLQAIIATRSYWTSNPVISSTNRAWAVSSGGLVDIPVTWSSSAGVRPVITISKSDVGN